MHTIQALHAFMDQHSTQAPHAQMAAPHASDCHKISSKQTPHTENSTPRMNSGYFLTLKAKNHTQGHGYNGTPFRG